MTDIKQKALALLNDVRTERGFAPVAEVYGSVLLGEALCRAIEQIEQHEAFKQKVSDIVEAYVNATDVDDWEKLKALIIPQPKPDPLVEAAKMMGYFNTAANAWAGDVRAALEARGLEIKEKNDG